MREREPEPGSKLTLIVLIVGLILSGIGAILLAYYKRMDDQPPPPVAAATPSTAGQTTTPPVVPAQPAVPAPGPGATPPGPETMPKPATPGPVANDPAAIAARLGKALESGDMEAANKLLGDHPIDAGTAARIKTLAGNSGFTLREVGELEQGDVVRWALELPSGSPPILLDLRRKDGKWTLDKITLPPAPGEAIPKGVLVDSLGITDAFLQAVLHQHFQTAKGFVDPATVSDAKIAGLCILFEEGHYRLRGQKPLRSLVNKPDVAGYLASVETRDGTQAAQFTIMLALPADGGNWRVSEVNLDQLLADYAKRFANGDTFYSPLVANPKGGDTLVLYFEFDQDQINERTRRQLEIVAQILKLDAGKKLTLSGHTDALGEKSYNERLSERRADVVRDFLVKAGVAKVQIVTEAKGMSQPRRPNFTESGADDPEGRRANRRTEIYLDF